MHERVEYRDETLHFDIDGSGAPPGPKIQGKW